ALCVCALEVRVRHPGRTAVARAHYVDRVQVALLDHAVGVGVDEVDARRRAPVPEQPRLDVLELQRPLQERVVQQVDLARGDVVGDAPVGVDEAQLLRLQRSRPGDVRRGGGACLAHRCAHLTFWRLVRFALRVAIAARNTDVYAPAPHA